MKLDDLTEEELRELEIHDDEYEKESIFKKIANIFKKKKNNDVSEIPEDIPVVKETFREKMANVFKKKKNNDVNEIPEDIPVVKETFREKITNSFNKLKAKRAAKKNLKNRKKKNKSKESLKDKFNRLKAKRAEKKATKKSINKQFIKSLALTLVSGTLTLLSTGAIFVAASMATTMGIIPAILVTALFVGSTAIAHCVFEGEFDNLVELNEIRKNGVDEEVDDDLDTEEVNEQELSQNMDFEEVAEQELANEEEQELEEVQSIETPENIEEEKILKTKLTREEKIGKIREFGIGHDSKLGIYCIPVPKEEKSLQRFIREEYKKEYPEEKIQTFETDENKVMVLKNKPSMFKK